MTRIVIEAREVAPDILAELEMIDPAEEPEEDIDVFGGTATATFSTGLVSVANLSVSFVQTEVTDGTVTGSDGRLLLVATEIGVTIDTLSGEPTNLDSFEGLDITLVDAPEVVDADAFLAQTAVLASAFSDLPIDELARDVIIDFGAEPPRSAGVFDPADLDTLRFDVPRAEVTETVNEDGTVTIVSDSGTAVATELERLELSDGAYVYDLSDEVSFVYRLYAASLARTPDEGGLRFWDGVFSGGSLRPRDLAQRFADSQEFEDRFLSDPSDEAFVEALYTEVLGRGSDTAGQDFWVARLSDPGVTRGDMLKAFADSQEFIDLTADDLDDGAWVVPPGFEMM